ncbi:Protein MAM3 [Talaromyces islandicus]|uniref:Protein MAM3 n=1 Tax=Talaromyces islandicus TaxID=28573 RepID=A0A0U1LLV8_TALIS|nr:Protein MAM3 [Talaromyces islandicus]
MRSALANPYLASRPIALGLAKVLVIALAQLPAFAAAAPAHVWIKRDEGPPSDPGLWLYLGVAVALVLSGGAFAGLTIALMGQDEIYLQVIKTSGEGAEKKNAAAVLRLLQRGKHWVLVTLLLSNVITNETLPIVLDRSLGGGWPAVVGSTVLIVIFGEIVPQSICVRYGLPIGAWMAPFVLMLMYIMSPIAWPVAKLLDRLLGEDHGTVYKKAGLKTLVTLHKTLGAAGEQLNSDEVTIISACLDLKEKTVGRIMTPMDDVFTMSTDTVLDEEMMDLILSQGYSRIPIHAPDNNQNFVGMLLVKMLITYDPEDCKMVRDVALATLPETRPETSCLDIVNFFQEGKSHMVLVSDFPGEDHGSLGVVTLEDVIEELIGEEIIDESDVFIDVHKAIRRMAPAPRARVPKGRIVEEPPTVRSTSTDGESNGNASADQNSADKLRRPSGSVMQPPEPRFTLRNSPNASDQTIVKRASRPRQTRYQNVKIKAPGVSPTRSGMADSDSGRFLVDLPRRSSEVASNKSGIDPRAQLSPLITPKDGVQALRQTYGTMSETVSSKNPASGSATDGTNVIGYETIYENGEDSRRPSSSSIPNRSNVNSSHSSEERSPGHSKSSSIMSGPARSGSITEQVLDVNGVRKVVLQTTNSSPSETGRGMNDSTNNLNQQKYTESDTQPIQSEVGSSNASKKKRRRRKKKNDGYDPENAPLLPR